MLAGTAAAEVPFDDEDLGALVLGPVEDEIAARLDVIGDVEVVAPVVEEEVAVAGALDALEELFGDDLVGVDVGERHRNGGAGEDVDRYHACATSFGCHGSSKVDSSTSRSFVG